MAEIITFQKADPVEPVRAIWVCNCGCTVHYNHSDGRVECTSCEAIADGLSGQWRQHLPPVPDDCPGTDDSNFKMIELDSAATFLKRRLKEGAEDVGAVLMIMGDGRVITYVERRVLGVLDDAVATAVSRMKMNLGGD